MTRHQGISMTTRTAIIQMVSCADIASNFRTVSMRVQEARQADAVMVFLPENFAYMGYHDTDKFSIAEEFGNGRMQDELSTLARTQGIWLVAGTLPLKGESGRVRAASLVFDHQGVCVARYDKIHLFDVTVSDHETHNESQTVEPGSDVVVVDTPAGKLGLSVCYDLRFPELYRMLLAKGAQIFSVPSAFTLTTGQAHWDVLLRARAIENQCFVLAPNQGGVHENGRATYGHSMAIDPWGRIMACRPHGEGMLLVDIDLRAEDELRRQFPCLLHRQIPF